MRSELTIGFTGDVSFTGAYARPRDPATTFSAEVRDFLAANDYNVFNIEGPITSAAPAKHAGSLESPAIPSPPDAALPALRHLRANVWDLANNHIMDCGAAGLDDTMSFAAAEGIAVVGAGREIGAASEPLVLDGGEFTVGILAVAGHGDSPATGHSGGAYVLDDWRLFCRRVDALRRSCRWVVVVYHGGEEFTFSPMPSRRRLLRKIARLGVDVVVGHHAHVVQGFERVGSSTVFYSLGDFVFDLEQMRSREGADQSILLRLRFGPQGYDHDLLATRCSPEGVVDVTALPPQASSVGPAEYRRQWCAAAWRYVSRSTRRNAAAAASASGTGGPLRAARPSRWIGRLIPRLRNIMRSPALRAIYAGALEHMVRRVFDRRSPVADGGTARR